MDSTITFAQLREIYPRPVYLFGAGASSHLLYSELRAHGVDNIVGLLDNSPDLVGSRKCSLPVLSPADPAVAVGKPLVVLNTIRAAHIASMREQCRTLGLECVSYPRIAANSYAACDLDDLWADEQSRQVYRTIARRFLTADPAEIPEEDPEQYFPAWIPDRQYHAFVDGGAYLGDTLRDFRARFGAVTGLYYAFEPDRNNYLVLQERARLPGVETYNAALSNQNSEAYFALGSNSCHSRLADMEEAGDNLIRTVTIDAALDGRPVTFIKMDVEGAEPLALEGAAATIARCRPALAISVYHSPSHLWAVPLWLRERFPWYRLFLRHHSTQDTETVCYAVPGKA